MKNDDKFNLSGGQGDNGGKEWLLLDYILYNSTVLASKVHIDYEEKRVEKNNCE